MGVDLLPAFVRDHYEVHEWKHACAILRQDFPNEWQDICALLTQFRLRKSWITVGGGRKSQVSEHIDHALYARGWQEKQFTTQIRVDEATRDTPTHKVDCVKSRVALEIETDNKGWPDLLEKPMRLFILCTGLIGAPVMAWFLPVSLWILAVLTHVTALQRFARACFIIHESEARAQEAAPRS